MDSVIHRQMIYWTLVLVLALGTLAAALILVPPEPVSASRHPSSLTPAIGGDDPAARPSSAYGEDPPSKIASTAELDLRCEAQTQQSYQNHIRQLRLSGGYCARPAAAPAIQQADIRNLTNGVIASLFYPGPNEFTTDYIALADGENRISIRFSFEGGAVETRELIVTRAATDANGKATRVPSADQRHSQSGQ